MIKLILLIHTQKYTVRYNIVGDIRNVDGKYYKQVIHDFYPFGVQFGQINTNAFK